MKRLKLILGLAALIFSLLYLSVGKALGQNENLLRASGGAKVVAFSSEFGGSWSASAIIDDFDFVGEYQDREVPNWCSYDYAPFPHWLVIELPKSTWITTLIFNNRIADEVGGYDGISAKDIRVEMSNASAKDGFATVASFQLEKGKNGQEVRIEPTQARWLKIVILSNHGNTQYTELGLLGALDDGSRPLDMASALKSQGKLDLYGLYFDFGSDVLRTESAAQLDQLAVIMKQDMTLKLSIEGHTDNVGDPAVNQTLSEKRALAVSRAMQSRGIAANRLTTVGYGANKPVADNQTPTGRAKNRRVTIVTIK